MAGDQNKFRTAMMHAERFSQQGDWQKANQAYRFALAEFPKHEAAIVGFGRSLMMLGTTQQAWQAFQQVLKINGSNTEALSSIAEIQGQMGQPQPAAQTMVKVGSIYASKGDFEAAIVAWEQATELFPDFPDAHRNIAQALAHLGENRLAARQFLVVAAIFQKNKKMPQAAQYVEAARKLLPDDPGVQEAMDALRGGQLITADLISETEPEPEPEPELDFEEETFDFPEPSLPEVEPAVEYQAEDTEEEDDDFASMLPFLMPDEPDEPAYNEPEPEPVVAEEEPLEEEDDEEDDDDLFSEAAMAEFAGEELVPEDEPPAEEDSDWDIFGFEEGTASAPPVGGLVEDARQRALSELANIIFEGEQGGPETSVLPDGRQVSRMEINMMVIQAIDMQTREDYGEAIDRYRMVVQANAGRPALYYNLGLLYHEQQEYQEAIKLFRMASPDPDYRISALFMLGISYYDAREIERALRQFTEVLKEVDLETIDDERYDELETYYENFADEFYEDEDTAKVDKFIEALQTFFSKSDWQAKVEEARQRMDSISDEEVMSLASFLESPETEIVVTALANTTMYLKQDLPLSASEECLRAIQRAPYYLPLHTRLADILFRLEQTNSAIRTYMSVASVYETRRQPEQALGVYKKLLKIAPLDVNVRRKLIDMQLARGKIDAAMENYLALADAHFQLAQMDKALERYNEALQMTAQTVEPNKWKVKILGQIGDIYNQRFDWTKATACLEEAIKLDNQNETISRQLIDLYYKQAKTALAIRLLDNLLKGYYQTNKGKAVSYLKELVIINADDIFLRQRLAYAYLQNGQRVEAIGEYDTLAELQYNNGMKDQAIQTLQAILKLKPENPEGYQQVIEQIRSGAM